MYILNYMTLSENEPSADNQQERLNPWWIIGFVDGEGCFSVSRFRNKTTKSGFQDFPEFVITQGVSSHNVMVAIKNYFNCGHIYINRRYDNHHEHLLRYCVRKKSDLLSIIIPFFQTHPLQTAKRKQFEVFCSKVLESPETTRLALKHIAPEKI